MKLWIDDIRNAPDDTWHVARTSLEAIRAMSRYDFDVISFDHDISHQIHLGKMSRPFRCEETFAGAAYYLALQIEDRVIIANLHAEGYTPPVIILHTSNQVAGDEMAAMFKDKCGIDVQKRYMGAANRLEMEV